MTQNVKIPDPVYELAKEEAEQRDITIGAVIDSWRWKASVLDDMSDKDLQYNNE